MAPSIEDLTLEIIELRRRVQESDALLPIYISEDHERLAKIAMTVPGVICSFRLRPDGSASMPYASRAIEEVYGLTAAEVAEDFSPVFDRIHPDDLEHIHASIAESAHTMTPWRDTFRLRHPTKGEVWLEGHSMPEREQDGSILWHGFIQDITERKSKEHEIALLNQKLEHRLEELQAIFDTVPMGLSIAEDTQGQHIRGNPAIENLLGLSSGAELSMRSTKPALGVFHSDGRPLAVDELPMQRAVRGEIVMGQIIEVVRTDGRTIHVLCYAVPLYEANRSPRGAIGAFMDITALREIEQELARNERFKQSVLDALPASIAVLDSQGVIRAVNQPWLRFAAENGGQDGSRIGVGVDYLEVCRPAALNNGYSAEALKGIQAVVHGEQDYFELEYPCHSPNMERWFLMQVVRPSPEVGGAIVIHLNITERKLAEAENRRHLEELERFSAVAVGRELRMIELKQQINELCRHLGRASRYRVDFDDQQDPERG